MYKLKYLKYKQKYLELKGGTKITLDTSKKNDNKKNMILIDCKTITNTSKEAYLCTDQQDIKESHPFMDEMYIMRCRKVSSIFNIIKLHEKPNVENKSYFYYTSIKKNIKIRSKEILITIVKLGYMIYIDKDKNLYIYNTKNQKGGETIILDTNHTNNSEKQLVSHGCKHISNKLVKAYLCDKQFPIDLKKDTISIIIYKSFEIIEPFNSYYNDEILKYNTQKGQIYKYSSEIIITSDNYRDAVVKPEKKDLNKIPNYRIYIDKNKKLYLVDPLIVFKSI